MSTMKVLICQEIKNLVWEVRERPVPGDNEALIKIKTVGICGTDIHAQEKTFTILISDSKLR
ncbi:alcohol dehydrogenase catalytic domain-containing protein [Escherichia coli]|nr:alcohol dehydrogenase catalytic domain-containing protein [Escherichia coli]